VVVLSDARAPNYELAYEDYRKGMKYKEIAEKYGVTLNTVKSWKTRYRWSKDPQKGVHTKSEKVCTQKGGQPGNRNAAGHGGTGPPKNKNAEKHGLFSKWLPEETNEIMETVRGMDQADILYENILIHQTALIRSQQIMYVKDRDDITKELKKVKTATSGMSGKNKSSELEYEFLFAHDKQASYLQAQSRAMQTLLSMITKFKEMTAPDDERLLRLELMEAELDKRRKEAASVADEDSAVGDWISAVMEPGYSEEADAE